jgi:hypothetical protein
MSAWPLPGAGRALAPGWKAQRPQSTSSGSILAGRKPLRAFRRPPGTALPRPAHQGQQPLGRQLCWGAGWVLGRSPRRVGVLKRVRRGGQAGGRSAPARCRERRRPPGPCLTRKNVLEVYNLPPSPASFHLSRQRASIHVKRSPDCLPPPLRTVTFNTYYWQGPSVVPAVSLAGQLQQTAL